jgi:hypothetical protein
MSSLEEKQATLDTSYETTYSDMVTLFAHDMYTEGDILMMTTMFNTIKDLQEASQRLNGSRFDDMPTVSQCTSLLRLIENTGKSTIYEKVKHEILVFLDK